MYECARNLEFERAASLRDELEQVRASLFKGDAMPSPEATKAPFRRRKKQSLQSH
jgi:excinuclease UvrABC nuclease subunit